MNHFVSFSRLPHSGPKTQACGLQVTGLKLGQPQPRALLHFNRAWKRSRQSMPVGGRGRRHGSAVALATCALLVTSPDIFVPAIPSKKTGSEGALFTATTRCDVTARGAGRGGEGGEETCPATPELQTGAPGRPSPLCGADTRARRVFISGRCRAPPSPPPPRPKCLADCIGRALPALAPWALLCLCSCRSAETAFQCSDPT